MHDKYTNASAKELYKVFKTWGKAIDWNQITESNYTTVINMAVDTNGLSKTYVEIYKKVGIDYGKRVGKSINAQIKDFMLTPFLTAFEANVSKFFMRFGISRVVTIENTYKSTVSDLLQNRLQNGLTIVDATREVKKIVNSRTFYRWQAERIARTETTAAANFGAVQAGEVSGFVMQKEWISAIDGRTRRKPIDQYDHLNMNGKRVGLKENFNVSGESLEYPGDPRGSGGNVINCRCTVAVVPKRDENGNLIQD